MQSGADVNDKTSRPRPVKSAVTAAALLVYFAVLLNLAGRLRQPIIVDIGPSTGRYGSGFEESEETPPTTSRWTLQDAEFDVPLSVEASMVHFSLRAARYVDTSAEITVTADGQKFVAFQQPTGRQRINELEAPLPAGPLKLGFRSDDLKLGMAVDWFRIDGARWSVPADEWTVWILPLGIFGAALLSGTALGMAAGATALLLGILAVVAAVDPFGFVHCMRDVAVPSIAFSMVAALVFRGRTSVVLAITATVLLKGGFLFHPNYFYNDVRQNDRYVSALRDGDGTVMERSRKAQVALNVGYPRIIAGKKYAFPYSPIFYLPFTALPPDRDIIVRAIKHVALFTTALEVAVAFGLARMLVPAAAGVAAWLTFAFPILTSRMLYAMWSTLAGHALDLLVIVMAARFLLTPKDARATGLLFLATLATFLIYVSSLFNTSAFLLALALLAASVRWRVVGVWLAAALVVVFGLYGDFTMSFVKEILPAILSGHGGAANAAAAAPGETRGLVNAFARIALFVGYGFPLFAVAGAGLILKRRDEIATIMKAYVLAFLGLALLRGLSGGLFKDLKEIEFAGPAFAILSAVAVTYIPSSIGRKLIVLGLVGTGIWMQYASFDTWSALVLR